MTLSLSLLAKEAASGVGMPARLMRYYAPITDRRESFEPDEDAAISEGQSQWLPKLVQTDSTAIPQMMASPARQGILAGAGGGLLGGAATAALGGSPLLAGGVGLGTGAMAGLYRYMQQRKQNEHLAETMRRLPHGATKRDYDAERMLGDAFAEKYGLFVPPAIANATCPQCDAPLTARGVRCEHCGKQFPGTKEARVADGFLPAAVSVDSPSRYRKPVVSVPVADEVVPPDDQRKLSEVLGPLLRRPRPKSIVRRRPGQQAVSLRDLAKQAAVNGEVVGAGAKLVAPALKSIAPGMGEAVERFGGEALGEAAGAGASKAIGSQAARTGFNTVSRGLGEAAAGNAAQQGAGGVFSLPSTAAAAVPTLQNTARVAGQSVAPSAGQGVGGMLAARTPGAMGTGMATYLDPKWNENNVSYSDPRRLAATAGATAVGYTPYGQGAAIGHTLGFGGDVARTLGGAQDDWGLRYWGAGAGGASRIPGLRGPLDSAFSQGSAAQRLGQSGLGFVGLGTTGVGGVQLMRSEFDRGARQVTAAGDQLKTQLGITPEMAKATEQSTVAEAVLDKNPAQFEQMYPDIANQARDASGRLDVARAKQIFGDRRLDMGGRLMGLQPGQLNQIVGEVAQFRQNPAALIDHAVKSISPEQKTQWLAQLTKGTAAEGLLDGKGGGLLGMLAGGGGTAAGLMGAFDGIANKMLSFFGLDAANMSTTQKVMIMLGGLGVVAGGVSALAGGKGLGAGLAVVGGLGLAAGLFGDKLGIGKQQAGAAPAAPQQQPVAKPQQAKPAYMSQASAQVEAAGVPVQSLRLGDDGRPTSDDPAVKQMLDVKMQDPEFARNVSELLREDTSSGYQGPMGMGANPVGGGVGMW